MSPHSTAKRKENASALIMKCMISPHQPVACRWRLAFMAFKVRAGCNYRPVGRRKGNGVFDCCRLLAMDGAARDCAGFVKAPFCAMKPRRGDNGLFKVGLWT